MAFNIASGYTGRAVLCAAFAAIISGCSTTKTTVEAVPVTQLPEKPLAAKIECEELSDIETQACLQEGPDARKVCWKVEKNDAICDGNQEFITRLYKERQGK